MRHKSKQTIDEMMAMEAADLGVPRMSVKLEEVSWDVSGRVYERLLRFLGFEGEQLRRAAEICGRHALWSMNGLPAHSRGGVGDEWRRLFTADLHAEFRELFGDAERALGYRAAPFPSAA